MRSLSLLALCALPGLVPSAWAAPTIEEQALRAALDGRWGDAVRLLDGDDATLRWTAGRHALLARDHGAATRLFSGQAPRDVWGRIDLAAARGDLANAFALALTQLDLALPGAHRDALGKLWAGRTNARRSIPTAARSSCSPRWGWSPPPPSARKPRTRSSASRRTSRPASPRRPRACASRSGWRGTARGPRPRGSCASWSTPTGSTPWPPPPTSWA